MTTLSNITGHQMTTIIARQDQALVVVVVLISVGDLQVAGGLRGAINMRGYICHCDNSDPMPSALPDRVYTCRKCGGKLDIDAATRLAEGRVFTLQVLIHIEKEAKKDADSRRQP